MSKLFASCCRRTVRAGHRVGFAADDMKKTRKRRREKEAKKDDKKDDKKAADKK